MVAMRRKRTGVVFRARQYVQQDFPGLCMHRHHQRQRRSQSQAFIDHKHLPEAIIDLDHSLPTLFKNQPLTLSERQSMHTQSLLNAKGCVGQL